MKKRLISASILLAILIPVLIIGDMMLRILVGTIAILAYREIIELKGQKHYPPLVILLGLMVIVFLTFSNRDVLYLSLGLNYKYLFSTFVILFLPVIFYYGKSKYNINDALFFTSVLTFLGITLNIGTNIAIYNKELFIMLLLVSITTDSFAFLTGKVIGTHKFTRISPNKTIEGCIGGLVMGMIIPSIYYITVIKEVSIIKILLFNLVLSLAGVLGDLFFSAIKREFKVKDYSNLIPGHGGILDRIDSLLFVIMAYVLINGMI